MPLANTQNSYGSVARTLHWLTALLILSAIPLGVIANDLPFDTSEALAQKAQLFSYHKTLGVAAFSVAVIRILWALTQPRPVPLHPERRIETLAAGVVHWTLYLSLMLVPLSGWVHHAATSGFAPILWPFGQHLPFVPQSEAVAATAGSLHWVFTKLLIGSILLHILGAVKHTLIDRDATLFRMLFGERAPARPVPFRHPLAPLLAALALYGAGAALAVALVEPAPTPAAAATAPLAQGAGNWVVQEGRVGFTVRQLKDDVEGSFATWSAEITFDEEPKDGVNGHVSATIAIDSLTLGSVTKQALQPDFFDAATHPTATFEADIVPADPGYSALGTLTLRGVAQPVTLPFALTITGDIAVMEGETTLDRRDFGMGAKYPDEATVGFPVSVSIQLTAKRKP